MLAKLTQAALLTLILHLWMSLSAAQTATPTTTRPVPQVASISTAPH